LIRRHVFPVCGAGVKNFDTGRFRRATDWYNEAGLAMKPRVVNCPQCGASVVWDPSSPFRPFCSERCRLIDLGAWASETYRIPVSEEDDAPESGETGGEPPAVGKRGG
jgi:endogenous inhibitor of DNA gyrase (YacG/DUF329 family)